MSLKYSILITWSNFLHKSEEIPPHKLKIKLMWIILYWSIYIILYFTEDKMRNWKPPPLQWCVHHMYMCACLYLCVYMFAHIFKRNLLLCLYLSRLSSMGWKHCHMYICPTGQCFLICYRFKIFSSYTFQISQNQGTRMVHRGKISFYHTGIIFLSQVLKPGLSLSLIDNCRTPPLNPLTFVPSLPGWLLFHCSSTFTYGWPGAPGLSFPTGIQPWTLLLFYSSDLWYTKF